MANNDATLHKWDLTRLTDDPTNTRQYCEQVGWHAAGTPDRDLRPLAPRLIARASPKSNVAKFFEDKDSQRYRIRQGAFRLLEDLTELFPVMDESELGSTTEDFLATKHGHEDGTTKFILDWKFALTKPEDSVNSELQKELVINWQLAVNRWAQTQAAHERDVAEWQLEVEAARAGAAAELQERSGILEDYLHLPPEPLAPEPPGDVAPRADFPFPEVWTGHVFLHPYGGMPEQKASMLRGTSGSTELTDVIRLFRQTEQFRGSGHHRRERTPDTKHGYLVGEDDGDEDGGDDDDDDYDEDKDDDDGYDTDENVAWYKNEYEKFEGPWYEKQDDIESTPHAEALLHKENEPEWYEVYAATAKMRQQYVSQRNKLKAISRNKGFVDVGSDVQHEPVGKPLFSQPPRHQGSQDRERTPSRRKGKGKGCRRRDKGKGKSRDRRDGKRAFGNFSFAYPAYGVSGKSNAIVYAAAPAARDPQDGLQSRNEQKAYLANVPGYGVLDCGATRGCKDVQQAKPYMEKLHEEVFDIKSIKYKDTTRFTGIGPDPVPSLGGIGWPCCLGGKMGLMHTSVLPGNTPLLIFVSALTKMSATVDFGRGRILLPHQSKRWQKLIRSKSGHLLLPLFDRNQNHPSTGREGLLPTEQHDDFDILSSYNGSLIQDSETVMSATQKLEGIALMNNKIVKVKGAVMSPTIQEDGKIENGSYEDDEMDMQEQRRVSRLRRIASQSKGPSAHG